MSRKLARRHAFHIIYQMPFHSDSPQSLAEQKMYYTDFVAGDLGDIDDFSILGRPMIGRDADYIEKTVWGVFDNQQELDAVICRFLKEGWAIDRINKVELALLRLAIFEMLILCDVPSGVAISEAVELAASYSSDESPAFVNGILSRISENIPAKGSPDASK